MPEISRQLLWQRDHNEKGLCGLCSDPLFFGGKCEKHYRTGLMHRSRRSAKRSDGALGAILLRALKGKPLANNGLGQMIRQFRADNLMSIAEFAERAGTSSTNVVGWEKHGGDITVSSVRKIAKAMSIPPSDLFTALITEPK